MTWAVQHGQLACAYLPRHVTAAPLYPLISGGIAALVHIGNGVAFPTSSALGVHCASTAAAYAQWSQHAKALNSALQIGFVSWLVLMAGVVALLRSSGRGCRRWEPAALAVLACLPPLWFPIGFFFHPQDILALGLGLGAMASARRDAWFCADILIALAFLSQQFATLIAVPLVVLAPPARRLRLVAAVVLAAAVVVLPFILASSGRPAPEVLLGSGDAALNTGTLLAHLRLTGAALFVLSRLVPIAVSLLLSMWIVRRLGRHAASEPVAFMSLITLSLSLRLVFETSLYGYYLTPLAVALVLREVIRGAIRPAVVVWLAVASLAYMVGTLSYSEIWRFAWQNNIETLLSPVVFAIAFLIIGYTIRRHGLHREVLPWVALALGVVFVWPTVHDPVSARFTTLDWQLVLVVPGSVLALLPLLDQLSRARAPPTRPARTEMRDLVGAL